MDASGEVKVKVTLVEIDWDHPGEYCHRVALIILVCLFRVPGGCPFDHRSKSTGGGKKRSYYLLQTFIQMHVHILYTMNTTINAEPNFYDLHYQVLFIQTIYKLDEALFMHNCICVFSSARITSREIKYGNSNSGTF